jgi:hypothetical protein
MTKAMRLVGAAGEAAVAVVMAGLSVPDQMAAKLTIRPPMGNRNETCFPF